MNFLNVLQRELLEQTRNRKLFLTAFFILFGAYLVMYKDIGLAGDSSGVLDATFNFFHIMCALIAGIVAMDAIVGEKEQGTLELVLSKPLQRVTLLLGKFVTYVLAVVPVLVIGLILVYYWAKFVGLSHWQSPLPPMSDWLAMLSILSLLTIFHIAITIVVSMYAHSAATALLASLFVAIPGSPFGTSTLEMLGWTDFTMLSLPARVTAILTSEYQTYALLHSPFDFWIVVSLLLLFTIVLMLVGGWLFEKQDIAFR